MAQLNEDEKKHRELERRSQDIIAVYNPTDKDVFLVFNMTRYIIPSKNRNIGFGNGKIQIQRYLAERFVKKMIDQELMERSTGLVKAENDRRAEKGMAYLTKYPGENSAEIIESTININDLNLRRESLSRYWLGIVQKAPEDLLLIDAADQPEPGKTVDDQIFEALEDVVYEAPEEPNYTEAPDDIETKKNDFINSLAQAKGKKTKNEAQTSNI